jgi:hypothetical protein
VSHSVHLKPRPPTRGLSLRAARRTTGRPLAPPHRRVSATANRVPVLEFLAISGCRSQSCCKEKPRPWLGVRGEAEISGYNTFAEEASAPKQFGARRLVPLPDKEGPAEAGLNRPAKPLAKPS